MIYEYTAMLCHFFSLAYHVRAAYLNLCGGCCYHSCRIVGNAVVGNLLPNALITSVKHSLIESRLCRSFCEGTLH